MLKFTFKKTKGLFTHLSFALFLGTNISFAHAISEKSVISTYQGVNGPWQLLEYLFITKTQNELELFQKHSFAGLGIAGASFLAKSLLFDKQETQATNNNGNVTKQKNPIKSILTIFSVFAAGKTAHNYSTCIVKRRIQHKTLVSILSQWEMYRSNFPTSLVEFFDELAETYVNSCENVLTDAVVGEIFQLINHHIEHHFEGRYKKSEPKSMNMMDALKGGTDIWKNFA